MTIQWGMRHFLGTSFAALFLALMTTACGSNNTATSTPGCSLVPTAYQLYPISGSTVPPSLDVMIFAQTPLNNAVQRASVALTIGPYNYNGPNPGQINGHFVRLPSPLPGPMAAQPPGTTLYAVSFKTSLSPKTAYTVNAYQTYAGPLNCAPLDPTPMFLKIGSINTQ